MAIVHFALTQDSLQAETVIYQGQISYGAQTQLTYLGSCVAIILFSKEYEFAALSHIVGHTTSIGSYNHAHEVLDFYQRELISKAPFAYFLIGGADRCVHVLEEVRRELDKREILYKELDVLGNYYRRVFVDPGNQEILLMKKDLFTALPAL